MRKRVLSTNNAKSCVKKYNPNGEIEFRPVYFNSTTKTLRNFVLD